MLSKIAARKKIGAQEGFEWRGEEITRIEGLSDAVFGFVIALLIVSVEVPKTYDELVLTLKGFLAFGACFALLMLIWYKQYKFFRCYNLEDMTSIVLSMMLLFLVLFYAYPLKFMFMAWLGPNVPGTPSAFSSYEEYRNIFAVYALGFIALYLIFGFMYLHAYRIREELVLNEVELWDTKHEYREAFMCCGVGVLSLSIAEFAPDEYVGLAGAVFGLMGVVGWVHGRWSSKHRKKIYNRLQAESTLFES
jgi:uncharacterized membrane protein